jgi:hypothetical protein
MRCFNLNSEFQQGPALNASKDYFSERDNMRYAGLHLLVPHGLLLGHKNGAKRGRPDNRRMTITTTTPSAAEAPTKNSFATLALNPAALANLQQLGYLEMTPIQAASLPIALAAKPLLSRWRSWLSSTPAGLPCNRWCCALPASWRTR